MGSKKIMEISSVGGKNHVVSKQRFNQAYSEMIRGKFTDYDSFVTKIEMYLL